MADGVDTGRGGAPVEMAPPRRSWVARGPNGAPALVLLHGTRRTRAMWRHQLDGLTDAFRVIALDLPGHGALADVAFDLAAGAGHVSAVIDAEADGRAIVIGQSLGAYVGMDLAARRPDQVAGLVLANATAEPRTILRRGPRTIGAYLVGAAAEHVRSRATRPGGNGNGHSNEPSAPWAGGRPVAGEAPDAGDDGPATDGWLFRGGARAMLGALREAFVPRLAAYPGPTLIINGQGDVLFRTDERAFLRAAADGRLLVVPDCDHLVNEDRPDVFNSAVRAFAVEVFAREAAGSA